MIPLLRSVFGRTPEPCQTGKARGGITTSLQQNQGQPLGQTQHWVAEIIERRITDTGQLPTEIAVLPADPSAWQTWLDESARRVANECADDALDAPVFNPAGDERTGA